jgi:hypothetical protein
MKTLLLLKPIYLLGQILPAVMKNGIRALLEVGLCYQDCFIIGMLSITCRFMARTEHAPTGLLAPDRQPNKQIPVLDCGWEIWRIRACTEHITSAYFRAALTIHVSTGQNVY